MIYKAIPGPKVIDISGGNTRAATDSFAALINQEASNGWTYHSMETLTVREQVGCALQPQYVNTNLYMLIFCREEA
ncbi:MAG: hypothetical protein J6Q54_08325 [Oscillospiraceae bacterium]|nr:hypothetical protein [Oscillospiraceae bacterium]